jgi:hypothetical protein
MPNDLNYALPQLIMGHIKKLLDTFYPNKEGQFRPKNISCYYPLTYGLRSRNFPFIRHFLVKFTVSLILLPFPCAFFIFFLCVHYYHDQ